MAGKTGVPCEQNGYIRACAWDRRNLREIHEGKGLHRTVPPKKDIVPVPREAGATPAIK
jgi:hypothetical protein